MFAGADQVRVTFLSRAFSTTSEYFGAATALTYVTNSVKAAVLAFFIAILVAQSRVEGEIHSIKQVVAWAEDELEGYVR